MAFTEFCCRSGGSNLNAGTRTGSSTEPGVTADFTYASGSWVAATGVFTVASGNPSTDGVAAGDFASVYADGSTVTGFIGRVTAVSTTTITVSLTARLGTAPADGASNRTLKIGGAWQGPNGASGFPWTVLTTTTMTNVAGDAMRWNLKNDQVYRVTASITGASAGIQTQHVVQGYTSAYGDGGFATIDGGTSGASYIVLNINYVFANHVNLIFANNGATGAADLVSVGASGTGSKFYRCVFTGSRLNGLIGQRIYVLECEAYGNNLSNTAAGAGFKFVTTAWCFCIRSVSHDNAGSNSSGFVASVGTVFASCVADTNGGSGIACPNADGVLLLSCDAYNNVVHGFTLATSRPFIVENCNAVKNGAYGIQVNPGFVTGFVNNCGFGSGTQANTSGQTSGLDYSLVAGSVTYPADVTPWADPANGDFRITLASAKGTGIGTFLETASGYSGTVGYPDIGAAQAPWAGVSRARVVNS